jgi:hypothetical protein
MEAQSDEEGLVIERALRAVNRHTRRNPDREGLIVAVSECELLFSRQPHLSTRFYIVFSQAYEMLGDPIKCFRTLSALSSLDDRTGRMESANRTVRLLRKLAKGKFPEIGSAPPSDRNEIKRLISAIAQACPNVHRRNRIRTFAALTFETPARALELATKNAISGESEVLDLLAVIHEIAHKPRNDEDIAKLAVALAEAQKLSQAPRVLSQIDALRLHFLNQPALLARLGLDPMAPEELRQKLGAAPAEKFRSLAYAKSIYLSVYDGDEECKNAIISLMRDQLLNPAPHPRAVLEYLARASETISFWSDAEQRNRIFDDIFKVTASRRDEFASMVRGCVHFLRLEAREAFMNFNATLGLGNHFHGSGASSFFLNFNPDIDPNALLRIDVTGQWPAKRSDKALINCSDARYFCRFGPTYISSLRATGSEIHAHFHIAAPDDAAYALITSMSKSHANISFSFETPPLRIPAYYASMRFLRAPFFIRHIADAFFLTDIDFRFRRKPDTCFDHSNFAKIDVALRIYDRIRIIRSYDASNQEIYRYPRIYPWAQLPAGFVGVFATTKGEKAAGLLSLHMAQHLLQAMKNHSQFWWIDQNSLFHTYRVMRADGGFNIGNLEEVGLPFGHFDYREVRALGGSNPVLSSFPKSVAP